MSGTPKATAPGARREEWEPGPDEVVLGVDIIELVSSSMYVEPLTIYREYIQNAADAIDDARAAGLIATDAHGIVDIVVDPATRTARIRDNGIGVPGPDFVRRLTAFGASAKRGGQRRGFRGVGRLAALGYCQELLFRSRSTANEWVHELRWDCRLLRTLLRSGEYKGTLGEAVRSATSHRRYPAGESAAHFFEAELKGVVRLGKDDLLNDAAIRAYLGQVAPVPFARAFRHREKIRAFLGDLLGSTELHVFVNSVGPVCRPYGDTIPMRPDLQSNGTDLSLVTIPGTDSDMAARGWVLHHEYLGAVPRGLGIRGLRLRSGDIQVGNEAILEPLFAEPRFNAWAVGEFHVADRRIVPNGRRDNFEQGVHFSNLLNHTAPIAKEIASRCRSRSQYRQLIRKAEFLAAKVEGNLKVLRQGAISAGVRRRLIVDLETTLDRMDRTSRRVVLSPEDRTRLRRQHASLERRVKNAVASVRSSLRLQGLTPQKRHVYEEVFSLIYSCASDQRAARELVQRVLAKIKA